MNVVVGPGLAIALIALVAMGYGAAAMGRLGTGRELAVAAARAVVQLAIVALVLSWALTDVWGSLAVVAVMFGVAVFTTAKRTGVLRCWPYVAAAVASGVLPVTTIVFASGAAPFSGVAIVALSGIVIGNMMTAHTLTGRRAFADLRANQGTYEAGLALGLPRPQAMNEILLPAAGEALLPTLDQTRTVGLVTLPGAFIGVLLGGGSPLQAAAAQVLVLIGVMAGQSVTVTVGQALIRHARILPADLKLKLIA